MPSNEALNMCAEVDNLLSIQLPRGKNQFSPNFQKSEKEVQLCENKRGYTGTGFHKLIQELLDLPPTFFSFTFFPSSDSQTDLSLWNLSKHKSQSFLTIPFFLTPPPSYPQNPFQLPGLKAAPVILNPSNILHSAEGMETVGNYVIATGFIVGAVYLLPEILATSPTLLKSVLAYLVAKPGSATDLLQRVSTLFL